MGMRIGLVPIISVAPIGKTQLQNFAKQLDQHNISIDCGKTQGREDSLDPSVDRLRTGMPFTFGEQPGNGHALMRDLVSALRQLLENDFKSFLWSAIYHPFLNKNNYHLIIDIPEVNSRFSRPGHKPVPFEPEVFLT
jgi:hypothetical protein